MHYVRTSGAEYDAVSLGESFTTLRRNLVFSSSWSSTQDSENEGIKSLRNVGDYQTTRRHNPHDLNLQEQWCENLKPRKTDS
jgi:hypothetical protein